MEKPHLYLWAVSAVAIIACLLPYAGEAVDINLHDTYIVTTRLTLILFTAFLYFSAGLPYTIMQVLKKHPRKWMVRVHVWGSIAAITIPVIFSF